MNLTAGSVIEEDLPEVSDSYDMVEELTAIKELKKGENKELNYENGYLLVKYSSF